MEQLTTILLNGLATILTAVIAWLSIVIKNYFNEKATLLKEKTNSELTAKYIDEFNVLVGETVAYVSQTYVELLKKENKFTTEEHIKAFNTVYEHVSKLASNKMINAVNMVFGDFHKYLELQIEKEVKRQK